MQAILYRLSDLLTLILFISVEKTPTSFKWLDLNVVEKTNKTKSRKFNGISGSFDKTLYIENILLRLYEMLQSFFVNDVSYDSGDQFRNPEGMPYTGYTKELA